MTNEDDVIEEMWGDVPRYTNIETIKEYYRKRNEKLPKNWRGGCDDADMILAVAADLGWKLGYAIGAFDEWRLSKSDGPVRVLGSPRKKDH